MLQVHCPSIAVVGELCLQVRAPGVPSLQNMEKIALCLSLIVYFQPELIKRRRAMPAFELAFVNDLVFAIGRHQRGDLQGLVPIDGQGRIGRLELRLMREVEQECFLHLLGRHGVPAGLEAIEHDQRLQRPDKK